MISAEDFNRFMNDEKGGKNLTWINYFKTIPDSNLTSNSIEGVSE
jgi:hypothetical protein